MIIPWLQLITILAIIITALGAILAVRYSSKTYRQIIKFREEDRQLRRAYMVPCANPGYFNLDKVQSLSLNDPENILEIKMENAGQNYIENIQNRLIAFNWKDINESDTITKPVFTYTSNSVNPLPSKGTFTTILNKYKFSQLKFDKLDLTEIGYLVAKVKYYDRILNKTFKEIFYWKIEERKNLLGISDKEKQSLNKILLSNNLVIEDEIKN